MALQCKNVQYDKDFHLWTHGFVFIWFRDQNPSLQQNTWNN